jgi:hypothetical protein
MSLDYSKYNNSKINPDNISQRIDDLKNIQIDTLNIRQLQELYRATYYVLTPANFKNNINDVTTYNQIRTELSQKIWRLYDDKYGDNINQIIFGFQGGNVSSHAKRNKSRSKSTTRRAKSRGKSRIKSTTKRAKSRSQSKNKLYRY